jgi:integrase
VRQPLLFISRTGLPLSVTAYGAQFRHYADFAGVTGWSLHGLRHYALSQIARTDVLAAQQIAGHTSLVVTQGYLHTSADQVRAAHPNYSPVAASRQPAIRTSCQEAARIVVSHLCYKV